MLQKNNLICLLVISIVSLVTSDYCSHHLCSNPKEHVYCLYPNTDPPGKSCHKPARTWLYYFERPAILEAHNSYRRELANTGSSVPLLEWDPDLQVAAQRWSLQCQEGNDGCRSLDKYQTVVYQNVYTKKGRESRPPQPERLDFNFNELIRKWSTEDGNPANPSSSTYASINRVGCGYTKSHYDDPWCIPQKGTPCVPDYTIYFVCNYATYLPFKR